MSFRSDISLFLSYINPAIKNLRNFPQNKSRLPAYEISGILITDTIYAGRRLKLIANYFLTVFSISFTAAANC
jgi:hypothetical protein